MSSGDKKMFTIFIMVSMVVALPVAGVVAGMVFMAMFLVTGFMVFCGKTAESAGRKSFWERLRRAFVSNDKVFQKVHQVYIEICSFVLTLFPAPAAPETTKPAPEPEEDEFW